MNDMSSEILHRLLNTCNLFRGFIDSAIYQDYILRLLFFKYLSDYDKHNRNSNNGDFSIHSDMDGIFIPEEMSFDYIYENREDPEIGKIINCTLEKIEQENEQQLYGVFNNTDYTLLNSFDTSKGKSKILKSLIEEFKSIELGPEYLHPYLLGEIFEQLINKFAIDAGKKGGEFYTPLEVCKLVSELVRPKNGDKVIDPMAGSGGLLIETVKRIEGMDFSLNAQEKNKNAYALCKMNVFMHGLDRNIGRIEWGDTITEPKFLEDGNPMKFNVIVSAPPFSARIDENYLFDDDARFKWGIPPKGKGDYAFISHIASMMNEEEGRAAVIVPQGVLFRGGAEMDIRRAMVEDNIIEAVIGLPFNMLYNTSIPIVILILRRKRQRDDILFIDASKEYVNDTNRNKLSSQNIEKIVQAYLKYENQDKYAYVASKKEIKNNDFNLNISRYVDTFEEETIDTKDITFEIEDLTDKMNEIRKTLNKYLEEIL